MKKKKAYVDLVLEQLLDNLEAGKIQPGERVNSADVARQLDMSRGPVREALHVLAGKGVISLEKDRGAILRLMSKEDIIQLWDVLDVTCGLGLRLAGPYMSVGENALIVEEAMKAISNNKNEETSYRFYESFNSYHYEVNAICGNRQINELLFAIGIPYWNIFLARLIDVHRYREQYRTNYQRITDALLCGDGDSAASLFSYHAKWSKERIMESA